MSGHYRFVIGDFETNDKFPKKCQATQYAAVVCNSNFEIEEGSELNILVRPRMDQIPGAGAFKVTGISINDIIENGVNESEFAKIVLSYLTSDNQDRGTIIAGYNNFSFDDELMRHTLFRNLENPYRHEWDSYNTYKDRNKRFDIFHLTMAAYALRPDTLTWPKNEEGRDSLKLEHLSAANGIIHENAHDALSDVIATAGIARIIKEENPGLVKETLRLRDKMQARAIVENARKNISPLLDISTFNSKDRLFSSLILPIGYSASAADQFYYLDLNTDIEQLEGLSSDELQNVMYGKKEEGDKSPRTIRSNWTNKTQSYQYEYAEGRHIVGEERILDMGIDLDRVHRNLEYIKSNPEIVADIAREASKLIGSPEPAADTYDSLYTGISSSTSVFMSKRDDRTLEKQKQRMDKGDFSMSPYTVAAKFSDDKVRVFDLLVRYKWLGLKELKIENEDLSPTDLVEINAVTHYLKERFGKTDEGYANIESYEQELDEMLEAGDFDEDLANELKEHYQRLKDVVPSLEALLKDRSADLKEGLEALSEERSAMREHVEEVVKNKAQSESMEP